MKTIVNVFQFVSWADVMISYFDFHF